MIIILIFFIKNLQKLHFEESLHCTKKWQLSEQKYALHYSCKNYVKNKNKGHSFFNLLRFAINLIQFLFSVLYIRIFVPSGKQ